MHQNRYRSILIVEDDHESNQNLQTVLSGKFDEVVGVYDGNEGWKAFLQNRPNIVIVDIELPGINGLDLVRYIRKIDSHCFIAVLTSYSDQKYLMKAVPLKLDAYILKPITSSKLESLLNTIQSSQKQLSEHIVSINDHTFYDSKAKIITHHNNRIVLTHFEITVLELLLYYRGEILLYETIDNAFCDSMDKSRNAIKIIISHLRKKIPGLIIRSVSNVGYILI